MMMMTMMAGLIIRESELGTRPNERTLLVHLVSHAACRRNPATAATVAVRVRQRFKLWSRGSLVFAVLSILYPETILDCTFPLAPGESEPIGIDARGYMLSDCRLGFFLFGSW